MKTRIAILLSALALFAADAPAVPVRVTADRVNIRAKPSFENSEVLGQLAYGQTLEQAAAEGDWIGVVPPPSVAFWVHGDYVRDADHVVTASRINVRAGPSVNYSVVTTLERGTVVSPRRALDGWLEIEPPEGLLVWVCKDFIADASPAASPALPPPPPPPAATSPESSPAPFDDTRAIRTPRPLPDPVAAPAPPPPPPEAPAAALPPPRPLPPATTTNAAALAKPPRRLRKPPATSSSAEIAPTDIPVPALDTLPPAAPAAAPTPIVSPSMPAASGSPLPASFKLVPLDGQGKTAVYEGVLRPAPLFNDGPTRYRVLVWRDNRWQILCHVFGEAAKFRALQDKSVRVRGREYWVQDASAPVLVPEQIQQIVPQEN